MTEVQPGDIVGIVSTVDFILRASRFEDVAWRRVESPVNLLIAIDGDEALLMTSTIVGWDEVVWVKNIEELLHEEAS